MGGWVGVGVGVGVCVCVCVCVCVVCVCLYVCLSAHTIEKRARQLTHMHTKKVNECAVYQVRLDPPLYSFNSTQPLSCLGSSVVRASA